MSGDDIELDIAVRFDGDGLRILRERAELSYADMASAAGCSDASYRRYEKGEEPGRLRIVRAIAHRLGVTVDDLYVPAETAS